MTPRQARLLTALLPAVVAFCAGLIWNDAMNILTAVIAAYAAGLSVMAWVEWPRLGEATHQEEKQVKDVDV